jgi:hypothetical protein
LKGRITDIIADEGLHTAGFQPYLKGRITDIKG